MTRLTEDQIATAGLQGWTHLLDGLQTRIITGDFGTGLELVARIGAAAEELDHHPDLDLRYTHLDVRSTSHDTGAVTERDVRLARLITEIATGLGLRTDLHGATRLELGLDTPDHQLVGPFWAAVLEADYASDPRSGDEVKDPEASLPTVWFQRSGTEEPRQRWHFDLWVDPSDVQPRIDAAVAAGGTLVSDAEAPAFWVLSDPEGNKICLCTSQSRG